MTMESDPEQLSEVKRRFKKVLDRYPAPDPEEPGQKPQWDRYFSHAKPAVLKKQGE